MLCRCGRVAELRCRRCGKEVCRKCYFHHGICKDCKEKLQS